MKKFTSKDRKDMIERIKQGEKLPSIAASYGIVPTEITRLVGGSRSYLTYEEVEIYDKRMAGASIAELAKEYRKCNSTISKICTKVRSRKKGNDYKASRRF